MGTLDGTARDEWILPTLASLLTPEQFAQVQTEGAESFWEAATRRGFTADPLILAALAKRFNMPVADVGLASEALRDLVPESLMRKYRVLPLSISNSVLDIATATPYDLDCEHALAFAFGRTVRMSLASPSSIAQRLDEVYRPENVIDNILQDFAGSYEIESISEKVEESEFELGLSRAAERPIIQLVDRIVASAIQLGASDIHLEPEETGVAVRYRIDGVLRQAMVLPKAAGIPLVSRVKIMAQLDIADRKRPQDGRARVAIGGGGRVDLRISTLPAAQGEKIVIRILDQRSTALSIDSLGLNPDELGRIQTLLQKREGIVFVTGPTGSGKTTTLYSMLRVIQARGVNIVTVEDPVEYRLPGVVQVQVNVKANLTFPAALRSILRQDPDVILVGEVRDLETAAIAVQASLTGHLVLATLHTIDAAGAVTRLMDIGVEAYKIASAVKGVVSQRLLRRVCPHCREPVTEDAPEELRTWFPVGTSIWRAVGCDQCANTGYRRRLAITEVLIATPEFERRIVEGESPERIVAAARDGGMRGLWMSGVDQVRNGATTLEEILRVLEPPGVRSERSGGARKVIFSSSADAHAGAAPAGHGAPPPRLPTPISTSSVLPGDRNQARTAHPSGPGAFSGASFELLDDHTATPHVAAMKVLLVEDDDSLRRALREVLELDGFTVFEAADGVIAIDQVDSIAPDVVVLDLNMPRLDGYGVLHHLRARPATANLPVVVLTAKGDEDSEVRAFKLGANDYLTKPFRASALTARLHSLLLRSKR